MRMLNLNLATVALLCAGGLGQAQSLSSKIDLPKDSPVSLLSADFSNSSATARGGTHIVDVSATLSLRNASQRRIRAITLAVYAQEVASGGKGSVAVPGLDVPPGETFSVRIENRLLRPLGSASQPSSSPTVEVTLDGVLFDDLSFYGPDSLGSKSTMTVWELEARRDRKHFKAVLEGSGIEGLRKEMIAGIARQEGRRRPGAQPGVQLVRGRSTNAEPDQQMQFAFVDVPESPIEPLNGVARVSASEARAPRLTVRNRSNRAIEHFEVDWIIKDQTGTQQTREFYAASMPADLKLAPRQMGEVRQDAALHFQQPIAIQSLTGFISSVTFADGEYWVPSRSAINTGNLRELLPASPEEQRLLQIYNKRGMNALVQELKK